LLLADALKVNTSLTEIDLDGSMISAKGGLALANALKLNMSVTDISFDESNLGDFNEALIGHSLARNERFLSLWRYDARQIMKTMLCADEISVVWLYAIGPYANRSPVGQEPADINTIRTEYAAVVNERRRLELARPAVVSDVCALHDRIDELSGQIAEQTRC
jgi:hypothetical protein